ncbi:unnamed protein product [Polarella glacialis]|uniref:Uncharacterized protein n=1 Tax=Polarella glacialis TaxID=89957 RepID=A0A813IW28_POLGL|nr:unnamed protein product [Polarella glacialis]
MEVFETAQLELRLASGRTAFVEITPTSSAADVRAASAALFGCPAALLLLLLSSGSRSEGSEAEGGLEFSSLEDDGVGEEPGRVWALSRLGQDHLIVVLQTCLVEEEVPSEEASRVIEDADGVVLQEAWVVDDADAIRAAHEAPAFSEEGLPKKLGLRGSRVKLLYYDASNQSVTVSGDLAAIAWLSVSVLRGCDGCKQLALPLRQITACSGIKVTSPVTCLGGHSDSTSVTSGHADGSLRLWDGCYGMPLPRPGDAVPQVPITSICLLIGQGGTHAVSIADKMQLWSQPSGFVRDFDDLGKTPVAMSASDDSRVYMTGAQDGLRLWNCLGQMKYLDLRVPNITSVLNLERDSRSNMQILLGTDSGEVFVWGHGGQLDALPTCHSGRVNALACSRPCGMVASGGADGMCFAQTAPDLAAATESRLLYGWDVGGTISAMEFIHQALAIASGHHGLLQVWLRGELLQSLSLSEAQVPNTTKTPQEQGEEPHLCMAWCGDRLCVGCWDGSIRVFSVACRSFGSPSARQS